MQSNIWKKSILIMGSLFLVLSLVGIGVAGNFSSSENDMAITSKVQAKFRSDSQLVMSNINVETKNGEVTLTGKVASNADIDRAAQLASYVDGVKKVDNRLMTMAPNSSGSSRFIEGSHASDCPVGANWSC